MKKDTFWLALGGTVAVGLVAYGVYRMSQTKAPKQVCVSNDSTDHSNSDVSTANDIDPERNLIDAKQHLVSSVYVRHAEASQIVNVSVTRITNDNADTVVTPNSEVLSKMSDEINNLLD